MNDQELTAVRRAYAKHMAFAARAEDDRLEHALFAVRREAFMGPGPWEIGLGGPRMTPDADPHWLYADVLVGLIPKKALNNGQPSFLAFLVALGRIQPGEHIVHIGAGVGYYTAIMAELAGAAGSVTAIEYEPELAQRAARNLAGYPQVQTVNADGAVQPLAPADVILVNAGASKPLDLWLDALKDGGRLILPLTVGFKLPSGSPMTQGHIFLIERRADGFAATWKSQTAIYPCFGAQDEKSEASLRAALKRGGHEKVRRLIRRGDAPDESCWAKGPDWALTFDSLDVA
jgi:protein-L-isoaspartate(D-aspartate) O-methyltransferase